MLPKFDRRLQLVLFHVSIINRILVFIAQLTFDNHRLPAFIHSLIPMTFHGVETSACFINIALKRGTRDRKSVV